MSTIASTPTFDNAKAEAFGERLLSTLNQGALCLMTSVGHRSGLFDQMSELPPSTADQIAEKAGLNARYVREWLGAMVTAGVVEVEPATSRYSLPAEHRAFLRASGQCGARRRRVSTSGRPASGPLTRTS